MSLGWAETLGGLLEARHTRGQQALTHARTTDRPVLGLAACVRSRPFCGPLLPGPEHPRVSLLASGMLRRSPVPGSMWRGHREKAQGLCHKWETKASLPSSGQPLKLRLSLRIVLPLRPGTYRERSHILRLLFPRRTPVQEPGLPAASVGASVGENLPGLRRDRRQRWDCRVTPGFAGGHVVIQHSLALAPGVEELVFWKLLLDALSHLGVQ